jgi:hypothetical protein
VSRDWGDGRPPTIAAGEQGESDIPRIVEFACNWLDKNPAAMEPRDRFRLSLTDGGTAGTREVALASLALIHATLGRLNAEGTLSSERLLDICNTAKDQHAKIPAGEQLWTKPVINLVLDVYYDLQPSKRSKRRSRFVVDTKGTLPGLTSLDRLP